MRPAPICALAVVAGCAGRGPSDPAPAPEAAAEPSLCGIWYGELGGLESRRGELALRRVGGGWKAHFGGEVVEAELSGNAVEATFAAALFRGTSGSDGISGFWVQTRVPIGAQPFATPVELPEVEPGVYRGAVAGVDDRLRLYLSLGCDDEPGDYPVLVRNPERNVGALFRVDRARRDGDSVRFFRAGDKSASPVFSAAVIGRDLLALTIGRFETQLARVEPDNRALRGLWPQPLDAPPYRYKTPAVTGDGWPVAHARETGVDPARLERLVRELAASPCAESMGALCPHAVVIARGGRLILDEYFAGYGQETPHDTRSAGKSLATTLIGIAVDRRRLRPEDRGLAALATYRPVARSDPRKRSMTIADLLTMSSGFACDDNDSESPGTEDNLRPEVAGRDFTRHILDLPMTRSPGERAVYCSINMYLLSPILEAATGVWGPRLVRDWLARPLDISLFHQNLSPDLRAYFGGGIHLRPRDMAKLGQLFAAAGRWRGRQVVSSAWVRAASRPRARINAAAADDYGYGYSDGSVSS